MIEHNIVMSQDQSFPRTVSAVCPHDCPSTCALDVELLDETTLGRVRGSNSNDYTAGVLCAKVSRYAERLHHPERLFTPMRRVGDKAVGVSAFRPISWDEALNEVAEKFSQAVEQHGSQSIWPYHYAGTMGLVQRDIIELFRNALKTSRQQSTFCTTLADAGWLAGIGEKRGVDPREIEKSELIVVWGGNPVFTQVNLMHHIAKARRQNDAKLVVIDAYLTETAKKADLALILKPGTDGALACAVMHQLIEDDLLDRDYLGKYTDYSPEFEKHLKNKTPEWASQITGLPIQQIIEFARLYGNTKRSFLRTGYGFTRSRNGAVNMHAATCLPAFTGAWLHEGGGSLYSNGGMYQINQDLIKGLDCLDPATRVLDQSRIGEVLCGNPRDLQGGPPVTAMIIQNTNPMVVAPDTKRVRQGLQRNDLFVCVHEQFMTETAAMADIVLPATMFLEHDDFYQAGGHTFLQVSRQHLPAPGECRSNHRVLSELARRLGVYHPGFEMSERELVDRSLQDSALPGEADIWRQQGLDCVRSFEESHFINGFATDDGRFHFKADWQKVGPNWQKLPVYPDWFPPGGQTDEQHPYRLVAAPARQFLNSSFTETRSSRTAEGEPMMKISADDAEALGITDGVLVVVGNQQGEITLKAKVVDGLPERTVVIESIWPNQSFEGNLGVNTLISSEPGLPNGGGTFHDTAVSIRPR